MLVILNVEIFIMFHQLIEHGLFAFFTTTDYARGSEYFTCHVLIVCRNLVICSIFLRAAACCKYTGRGSEKRAKQQKLTKKSAMCTCILVNDTKS